MRHAVLLTLCLAAGVALAAKAPVTKIVDGKEVVGGPAFKATPLVDVGDLKFYACTLKSNGAACTVITGTIVPHMAPQRQYVVTLDIDLYEVCGPTINIQHRGTVRVEIDRPLTERPTRFHVLAPPWYSDHARGTATKPATAHYTLRVALRRWGPPKPPPVVPEG